MRREQVLLISVVSVAIITGIVLVFRARAKSIADPLVADDDVSYRGNHLVFADLVETTPKYVPYWRVTYRANADGDNTEYLINVPVFGGKPVQMMHELVALEPPANQQMDSTAGQPPESH